MLLSLRLKESTIEIHYSFLRHRISRFFAQEFSLLCSVILLGLKKIPFGKPGFSQRKLEKGIREQAYNLPNLLISNDKKIHTVLIALEKYLPKKSPLPKPSDLTETIDLNIISQKLREIKKFLEINDMGSKDLFLEIKDPLLSLFPEVTNKLADTIQRLDFKDALLELYLLETNIRSHTNNVLRKSEKLN